MIKVFYELLQIAHISLHPTFHHRSTILVSSKTFVHVVSFRIYYLLKNSIEIFIFQLHHACCFMLLEANLFFNNNQPTNHDTLATHLAIS